MPEVHVDGVIQDSTLLQRWVIDNMPDKTGLSLRAHRSDGEHFTLRFSEGQQDKVPSFQEFIEANGGSISNSAQ